MLQPVKYPLTVFYDGSCAMCASEMQALKALDRGAFLELADCSVSEFRHQEAADAGVSVAEMMTLIHARDARGRWLVGVECFEAVYRVAGLEWVARFLGVPVLRPILEALYPWIARHRQILSRVGVNAIIRALMRIPSRPPDDPAAESLPPGPLHSAGGQPESGVGAAASAIEPGSNRLTTRCTPPTLRATSTMSFASSPETSPIR